MLPALEPWVLLFIVKKESVKFLVPNKVVIVTDTTACIPKEMVGKYGIKVVPIELIIDDRVYRDGIDISPAEFSKRTKFPKFFLPTLLFMVKIMYGVDFSAIEQDNRFL